MSIKDKPLKKCHSDKRVTIDKLHNNIIDDYKKQKENYNKKYDKESDSNKKSILKNKIKECNEYINEYYLNNGELLFDYYNDDFKTSTNDNSNIDNSILNFFNDNKKIEDKDNVKKDDTIIKYMSNIDDTYLNNNLDDIDDKINICKNCGNNNLTYKTLESEVFCNKCGYTEKVLFENDKTSYKETPKEISYFAYKRINHFNEWITQFQGKETTQIPNKIYNNIIEEIKKDVHLDIKNITNAQVRIILNTRNIFPF